jgi:integrase
MVIHKLSPRFVETVKIKGMYPDGAGLYLQVGPEGRAKSWIYRYHVEGRGDRQMGLGPLHTVGLSEARERARECRLQRLDGIDPIEARKSARLEQQLAAAKEVIFQQCAEEWLQARAVTLEPVTVGKYRYHLGKYVYPIIGRLPIQQFEMRKSTSAVSLVHRVLNPIWKEMPPTARSIQQNIENTLKYAIAKQYIAGDNAASMKGPLGILLPDIETFHKVENWSALPYRAIGAFMAELRATEDRKGLRPKYSSKPKAVAWRAAHPAARKVWPRRPMMAYAMEFLILTAVRKGQVLNMRWQDIDWEDRVWVCTEHKTRKKTQQDYLVPLSNQALAILETMRAHQREDGIETEYVFTAGRHGRHIQASSLNMLLIRAKKEITVHGFRTAFGDWSVDHGYDERDSEMALGHVVGNAVRNIYKRHAARIEPRRLMMQAWADYCDRTEPLPAHVIPFRQVK